jgi:hypothetical protein
MLDGARKLLGLPRSSRVTVHVPEVVSHILHRRGDQWGVAVLHGGSIVEWLTPKQARLRANKLIDLAWLASNPGQLPNGSCG